MISAGPARSDVGAGPWILLGVSASLAWGAATVGGVPPAAVLAGVALVAAVVAVVRRGYETALLALAATVVMPLPEGIRPGLLVATVALICVVAWRSAVPGERLGAVEFAVIGGVAGMVAIVALAAFREGQAAEIPAYLFAALLTISLFVALAHRVRAVGPQALAAGIALASLAASVIVIARLGGLPLVGSAATAATYSGAKSTVVGELGDVNGQALIIMLGLPILLAFSLHLRGRRAALALVATGIVALALFILLSRSSLVGGAVGCAVVLLLMSTLSPGRVAGVAGGTLLLLWYSAQDIQILASDSSNLVQRSTLWQTALDLWAQSPLIGHGPGSWPRLTAEQVRATPTDGAGGAHNLALSTLVTGGALATMLQVAVVLTVLAAGIAGVRRLRHARASVSYACLVGALGAFAAQLTRGGFEATGWPATRTNDLRTWAALLLVGVAVTIVTTAVSAPADAPDDDGPGPAGPVPAGAIRRWTSPRAPR